MKANKLNSCLAAVATALICTAPAVRADVVTSKENSFIKDSLEASMAETKLAEIAQTKATRPDIRAYAKMLVEHHSAEEQRPADPQQYAGHDKWQLRKQRTQRGRRCARHTLGKRSSSPLPASAMGLAVPVPITVYAAVALVAEP